MSFVQSLGCEAAGAPGAGRGVRPAPGLLVALPPAPALEFWFWRFRGPAGAAPSFLANQVSQMQMLASYLQQGN